MRVFSEGRGASQPLHPVFTTTPSLLVTTCKRHKWKSLKGTAHAKKQRIQRHSARTTGWPTALTLKETFILGGLILGGLGAVLIGSMVITTHTDRERTHASAHAPGRSYPPAVERQIRPLRVRAEMPGRRIHAVLRPQRHLRGEAAVRTAARHCRSQEWMCYEGPESEVEERGL